MRSRFSAQIAGVNASCKTIPKPVPSSFFSSSGISRGSRSRCFITRLRATPYRNAPSAPRVASYFFGSRIKVMNTSCTISSAAQVFPVMRSAKRYMAAWCRRYRSVNASSSPLAARRNRTSSLFCSAILISPGKTFCPVLSITSRHRIKKFPLGAVLLAIKLGSSWFHNRLDVVRGSHVSGKNQKLPQKPQKKKGRSSAPMASQMPFIKAGLFFRRLEHSCRNPRDEAAGDQAFAVCAQVISEAGNYVAFSSCERLQPSARYFFRGLGLSNEFLLSSHDMKFRLRRARAERANANSVRLHPFSKSFREEQVKSFRCRVG